MEAKKEIEQLKKKNVELFTQLEDKEINKNLGKKKVKPKKTKLIMKTMTFITMIWT